MKRTGIVWIVALVVLPGCSSVHVVAIPDETEAPRANSTSGNKADDAFFSHGGLEIHAYVTQDSIRHVFDGHARVHGDSVRFESKPENQWGEHSKPVVIELRREQVQSVEMVDRNVWGSVGGGVVFVVIAVTAAVVLGAMAAA
jgi:uncharacterized protein YceK